MAEQVPEVETQQAAEEQAPEAEVDQQQVRDDLGNKLNRLKDYVEIGALALQSLVMLDDIDDAFENRPSLLQEMNIDRQDMVHALAFIRTLNDHARRAQHVVQAEIKNNLQVRYPPAHNLAPADLDAADGEQ